MKEFKGNGVNREMKIGIVVAKFNDFITKKLLEGSLDAFEQYEIDTENIEVAWVPGAYEIPLVAKKMAEKNEYDALICLGAVIRGETTHYDYVCNQAATGIGKVSLDTNLPIIFGVLTTENKDQALERSGIKGKNHGFNYGVDAIEMVHLMKELDK